MDATQHSLIVRNSLYDKYVALIDAISRDDEMTVHLILFSKFGDSVDYQHFRATFLDLVRQIKRLDSLSHKLDEYPVIRAAKLGSTTILTKLHLFGFSLQETDIDGCDAMMYACHEGNLAMVEWLLDHAFEMSQRDLQGWTAFHYAAARGNLDIVRRIFPLCKTIDERTLQGLTALHLAATEGFVEIVEYLLSRGADKDAKDSAGMTALMLAAIDGRLDCVEVLMAEGAQVNTASIEDATALHYACLNGHTDVARRLQPLTRLADKDARVRGKTLREWAAKHSISLE